MSYLCFMDYLNIRIQYKNVGIKLCVSLKNRRRGIWGNDTHRPVNPHHINPWIKLHHPSLNYLLLLASRIKLGQYICFPRTANSIHALEAGTVVFNNQQGQFRSSARSCAWCAALPSITINTTRRNSKRKANSSNSGRPHQMINKIHS